MTAVGVVKSVLTFSTTALSAANVAPFPFSVFMASFLDANLKEMKHDRNGICCDEAFQTSAHLFFQVRKLNKV